MFETPILNNAAAENCGGKGQHAAKATAKIAPLKRRERESESLCLVPTHKVLVGHRITWLVLRLLCVR